MPVARGDFQQCTIYPFKIKEILPGQKTIDIKKKRFETINNRLDNGTMEK